MRRLLLLLILALPMQAAAQTPTAQELLQRMTAAFRAMPAYEVRFALTGGRDETVEGRFAVAGEQYYIALPDAEVFGTEQLRYEVDHRRRETVIAPVEHDTANLLSDPPHAFEFVASHYDATLEADNRLLLRPARTREAAIRLTLDPATHLPAAIRYETDDAAIAVTIRSVEPLAAPLPAYDRKATADYELIDFR